MTITKELGGWFKFVWSLTINKNKGILAHFLTQFLTQKEKGPKLKT